MTRTVSSAERTAGFKCSDSLLNEIWEEGAAALACDANGLLAIQARVHALAGCYVYGQANQVVEMPAQSAEDGPLSDEGLVRVMMLKDHSDYTVDTSELMKLFPDVKRLMDEWYPSCEDENGILGRERESAAENALYYGALRDSAELAARARDFVTARRWRERAEQVRTAFNRRLWDEPEGICRDRGAGGELSAEVNEEANYLAILFDVVDEARTARTLDYLDSGKPRTPRVELPAGLYVLEALAKVGRHQQALDMIRRDWGKKSGPTPVYWLMKHVAGIRLPDAEYRLPHTVDPQLCDLDWVKARLGSLRVNLQASG